MAVSANIVSQGNPMVFTQSEATAAQRTWVFYLSNSADGTPATGKTIAGADFRISKAGGAFGNAVGVVTELSLGWYRMIFDVTDLGTVGALACELSGEAGVDAIHMLHQVTVFDLNTATVALAAGGITTATFAAGAIDAAAIAADALGSSELAATAVTEVQAGLATAALQVSAATAQRTETYVLGTLASNTSRPVSMLNAIDCTIQLSGTFDSSTVTLETSANPGAAVPLWTAVTGGSSPFTAVGLQVVAGPHSAVRARMSSAGGGSAVVVTALVRFAV